MWSAMFNKMFRDKNARLQKMIDDLNNDIVLANEKIDQLLLDNAKIKKDIIKFNRINNISKENTHIQDAHYSMLLER